MLTERIVSIEKVGKRGTFDLHVLKNHNFLLGNGILTHNSGKSYSAMFVAEKLSGYLGRNLSIDNVGFNLTEVLGIAEKAEIGSVIIMDEQTKVKGRGSQIESALLENIERVVRQHKLFFFFLSPRYVSHSYRYMIEVWQPGSDKPFDYSKTLEEQWKYTRCIVFNDKQLPIGYIVTESPSDKDFLVQYEEKKSKFIEGIRARQGSGRPKYLRDRAMEFLAKEGKCKECGIDFFHDFVLAKNKSLREVLVSMASHGEMISVDETKGIVNYCDYLIMTNENLLQKSSLLKKHVKDDIKDYSDSSLSVQKTTERSDVLRSRRKKPKKRDIVYEDE